MFTITASYVGPTEKRGPLVVARCPDLKGEVRLPWDHKLDAAANCQAAAAVVAARISSSVPGHENEWVGGCLSDGVYLYISNPAYAFSI